MGELQLKEKDLIGRVITFAAALEGYKGWYLAVSDKPEVRVEQKYITAIPEETTIKFYVHKAGEGKQGIVLENIKRRNYYLAVKKNRTLSLESHYNPPTEKDECIFKVETIAGSGNEENKAKCTICNNKKHLGISEAKVKLQDGACHWFVIIGSGGRFRDGFEPIASIHNTSGGSVNYSFEYTVGITNTKSSTVTKTTEFTFEMAANFSAGDFFELNSKFGIRYSREWQNSTSHAIEESKKTTATVEQVKPGQCLEVRQLQGKYGDYVLGTHHIQIVDKNKTEEDVTN